MSISEFKPISDSAGVPDDAKWQGTKNPLGAAIANRLINNTQFCAQKRLAAHSKAWDSGLINDTSLTTISPRMLPSNFIGHTGNVGGLSQSDSETLGVEFSTHPGLPLAIPFGWRLSPGANQVNVRVALTVENIAGGMYAYIAGGGGRVPEGPYPLNIATEGVDENTFEATSGFFTSDIRSQTSYAQADLTSTNGTGGMSYYDLVIDIPEKYDNSFTEGHLYDTNATVFLCFQSGVDTLGGSTPTVDAPSNAPALQRGNRMLNTTSNMSKYLNIKNPGKLHRVARFTYNDTTRTEGWHQVVQLRPGDVTKAAYASNNPEQFILWPAIPKEVVPPSLTTGPNAEAAEGTGLQLGDQFDLYPVTQFKVFSVSIQEYYT